METNTVEKGLKLPAKRTPPAVILNGEYDPLFELGIAVARWFWYRYGRRLRAWEVTSLKDLKIRIRGLCRDLAYDLIRPGSKSKMKAFDALWDFVGDEISSREFEQFVDANRSLAAEIELMNAGTQQPV